MDGLRVCWCPDAGCNVGLQGGYIDLVCGTSASGHNVVVQAHRLVCIACMTSQAVLKWHSAGGFVSRHSVCCGRRKHCCSPRHMTPGTHKDNWDDLRKVTAMALLACLYQLPCLTWVAHSL